MFLMNRLLLVLTTVLALIITAEVFYLFKGSTTPVERLTCFNNQSDETILNSSILESYRRMQLDNNREVRLKVVIEGKIISIEGPGKSAINKDKYPGIASDYYLHEAIITIKQDKAMQSSRFIVPEPNLPVLTVYQSENSKLTKIELNDLKVGDNILIEEQYDLLDKQCLGYQCVKQLVITKI